MLVDLHLHTCLSDGRVTLDDVGEIISEGDVIAITDHNCVEGWDSIGTLAIDRGFVNIRGVELRLRGRPDYLLYFPDGCEVAEMETALDSLRRSDHELSRVCYEEDFAGTTFDATFSGVKERLGSFCTFCDSRLLAEMVSHDRNSTESPADLIKSIRIAKGRRIDSLTGDEKPSRQGSFVCLIESEEPSWAFELARRNKGEIVLAHPLREVRRQGARGVVNETPWKTLERIAEEFAAQGGHCIELCLHDEVFLHELGYDRLEQGTRDVIACARQMGFNVVCGSDLHGTVSVARRNRASMKQLRRCGEKLFPEWLKAYFPV